MPELRFDGIRKEYGGHVALADIDLAVESGSFTVLIGPSGCGKTTLLELAAGLQQPTQGATLVDGELVAAPRRDTVMLFQQHNLFDWYTVRDNVAFGLRNRGVSRRDARRQAIERLGSVGLAEVAGKVPRELSGGMRQRVALARALATRPKLLLMDEPFASLDHQTRQVMQRYLLSTWRHSQATVLFVTHDLDESLVLADRVALMSGSPGRIVDVVDINLPRPRERDDPRLHDVRERLQGHLEEEVALSEFTGAELAVLDEQDADHRVVGSNGAVKAR
ncbi:MAG: ABC transporter ATP-binding protein [Solirubrobacteraceae bacterium]|jgi:NitT/TauT family transport system ATP-binding protein